MDMSNTLLMPFIDESESFTNGFECGQIWQRVSEGETFEKQLIHTENRRQIEMICELFGVDYSIKEAEHLPEWSYLTVNKITI